MPTWFGIADLNNIWNESYYANSMKIFKSSDFKRKHLTIELNDLKLLRYSKGLKKQNREGDLPEREYLILK